jgi:VWFA-related protein
MRFLRAPSCGLLVWTLFSNLPSLPAQQASPNTPTIRVTSRLVFLDVTVIDKKGRPVVKGLTKDDFSITDDKTPQRIFSFEPPETHVVDTTGDSHTENAPVTIFVLDLLNSSFEDFAYIRYMVQKYLADQPAELKSPAELLVLGNKSLEMVQGYTRSKADLLYALNHVPPAIPFKKVNGWIADRFYQSIDALDQIALQNKGVHGRKNIIWIGHGGPNIGTMSLPSDTVEFLNEYVHATTNTLVDSRISLFVIYPGLKVNAAPPVGIANAFAASTDLGDSDPFAGDINFGVFVNETGGRLFYNRNDINTEIKQSQELGTEYYTLTYQPPQGNDDGKFRRIRVSLRNPDLRAVTKTGYFSPDNKAPNTRQQTMMNLSEAIRATLPYDSLGFVVENIVRHPDTSTAEFSLSMDSRTLTWQPADEGKSTSDLLMGAASLNGQRDILASRLEEYTITAHTQDTARLARSATQWSITIRIPRKTERVRIVMQNEGTGRIGAVELDRKAIDAAPAAPTPEPQLVPRSLKPPPPAAPPSS